MCRSFRALRGGPLWAVLLSLTALCGAVGAQAPEKVTLTECSGFEIEFEDDVIRNAVGDPERVSAQLLDTRTVYLQGNRSGSTSFVVWFASGGKRIYSVLVKPDVEILERALAEVDPRINVEVTPDRGAIVLRGVVADVEARLVAVQIAESYFGGPDATARPAVAVDGGSQATATDAARSSSVIDLLRVERLPKSLEQRLQDSILELGAEDVTVRRIQVSFLADDGADAFVLEGFVPNQTVLQRVLQTASIVVTGKSTSSNDIRVLGDESGGARSARGANRGGGGVGGGGGAGGGLGNRGVGGAGGGLGG